MRAGIGRIDVTTLSELAVGARGKVVKVTGEDQISSRLLEMGLTPGASVQLLGTAPLGDPVELSIRGYRLSIRRSEAARVEIEHQD
jgi:Fe2+ transport system protein FeoA